MVRIISRAKGNSGIADQDRGAIAASGEANRRDMILAALTGTTAKAAAIAALASASILLSPGVISAQSPQQIVVTAPLFDVRVETYDPPAEGYNLDITLVNPTDRAIEADAQVISGPDGWQASLFKRVDALIVERVVLPPNSRDTSLNFHFIVPPGTENGEYVFRLGLFDGGRLLDDVEYNVTVAIPPGAKPSGAASAAQRVLPGGFEFEAQLTNRQGRVDETMTFSVILRSRDVAPLSFTLGANTPPGWQVAYSPSFENTRVGALSLTGGATQNFDVEVVPPANAGPGMHIVTLKAVAAGLDPVELPLQVDLAGAPDVNLTTESGRLTEKVTAGKSAELTVMVVNSGDEAADNVRFVSETPPDWTVTLSENPIPRIEAGASVELGVTVEAPEQTVPGDYNLRLLTVVGRESEELQFRITAVQSSSFGFIGIAVIVAVVVGLAGLFVRSGRR
jgi:hypothetical protein